MTSFFTRRLAVRTVVFTLTLALAMLTLRISDSSNTSAFTADKKAEKVKKGDNKQDSKRDRDDDDDDDDDDKKGKDEKKKDREDEKRERKADKDDDEDKDDEDKDDDDDDDKDDDDKDKDDDDDEDEDKDDDDEDEDKDDDDEDEDKDDDDDDDDSIKNKSEAVQNLATVSNTESEARPTMPAEQSSAITMMTVQATVETTPVPATGDAADDPAIWIDAKNPSRSAIIGSNKQGGLAVYSLDGQQIQYLPDGLMNNVDIRMGFQLNGQATAIITASNRQDNSIAIYRMNPSTRQLENAAARKITTIPAYGSCMYRSPKTGKLYYIVTSKTGDIEQWELVDNGGKVDAKRVRGFKVGSTVEGCVADDELGHLYISEEVVGIWKFDAEPVENAKGTLIDKAGTGGNLTADVEGLTIAYGKDGSGYLIASSQGNNSYIVYKREGNNEFVKAFKIAQGNGIDGVEETDGIDVTTANLGPSFPHGVLVVQDGINDKGNQNFKLVPFQQVFTKP